MSITIGNLSFDGPFTGASQLLARSGVYAILGRGAAGSNWIVVDIGESGDVKDRVENHDRKKQWRRPCNARRCGILLRRRYPDDSRKTAASTIQPGLRRPLIGSRPAG